ncbi:probable splicing factor, arginine/serine-rich 7 [Cylas formicarius]|uniref:probable splicing factor, arginine/serine-rich 7 n=1 Tax=Cylas formicarius TaxID=197179 RepID=UPI0029588BE7|nr:probable splicing factor, arginine/serine-rich 7 [Cylas formicarius]
MAVGTTKVIQVTNIAPQATKDQMQVLFGYLGKIEDIRLYPTIRDVSCPVQSRICYIKFIDSLTVGIAQHMTNTVFIDRALIVIPVQNGEIPDEYYALEMTRNGTIVPGLNLNEPKLPPHVVNTVQGTGNDQVILTNDCQLEANGLCGYPPLPATYDSSKVEETRRTVLVQNIDPSVTSEELIEFFTTAGEVKYLRTCVHTPDNSNHVLIEFSEQPSVINALKMIGTEFKGQPLSIQHATQPIIKPQAKSNEAAQKEIEEAMTRFKEAQNMINASIEPVIGMLTKDKRSSRRSRSRSRDRRRRRSRSRSRSRRSRSRRRRSASRKRSRSRERRRRTKSRSRKRSRSRSRRRSGSRGSKTRRSRSRSRKRSSRDRSRDRKSRERSRDRKSRARSRDRKSRERSRDRKASKEKSRRNREDSKAKEKLRETKDRKSEGLDADRKRSRSKSRSRSRRRSRSREKKKEKKRSRSRGGKRSPTPRARRRSRSKSKDRERESKKKERKEKKKDRSRSKSRDRKAERARSKSSSRSKASKNRDSKKESAVEKEKLKEEVECADKDSGEKSDNMDISNSP